MMNAKQICLKLLLTERHNSERSNVLWDKNKMVVNEWKRRSTLAKVRETLLRQRKQLEMLNFELISVERLSDNL